MSTDFYNYTLYISYPFQSTEHKSWLVDAHFLFSIDSSFSLADDNVILTEIVDAGSSWTFIFSLGSEGDTSFAVPKTSTFGTLIDASNSIIQDAYIVIGDISDVSAASVNYILEKTCIQTLSGSTVTSVEIANDTTVTIEEGVSLDTCEIANSFNGDIILKPGYNCHLSTDLYTNSITIGAFIGAGAGEHTELFSHIPSCGSYIYSINGIPPDKNGAIRFESSRGIEIVDATDIEMAFNLDSKLVCNLDEEESSG
jgi:hypothetical protein